MVEEDKEKMSGKRDKTLNLRITEKLWGALDDYCKKNNATKTEVVELGIELLVYGINIGTIKRKETDKEIESLIDAIDIIASGVESIEGKYTRSLGVLNEYSYRLQETKKAIKTIKENS